MTTSANTSSEPRSGSLVISGVSVQVFQSASECSISAIPSTDRVSAAGGTVGIQVRTTPSDCRWHYSVDAPWNDKRTDGQRTGQGVIEVGIPANKTDSIRICSVWINGMRIAIRQSHPPILFMNSVVHAATFKPSSVSPGQLITVFGIALGPERLVMSQLEPTGLVSTKLQSVHVLFDDVPAPLLYVREDQIAAIAPYRIDGREQSNVTIEYDGVRSAAVRVPVAPASPGIFTADACGEGQIAAINQDGGLNFASAPAARGSVVILFATGEGQTDPEGVDGRIARSVLPKPLNPVSVLVDGVAGAAPEMVAGVLQVNFRLPLNVRVGPKIPIMLKVGQFRSAALTTIAISE